MAFLCELIICNCNNLAMNFNKFNFNNTIHRYIAKEIIY